jgi:hypothetical protein
MNSRAVCGVKAAHWREIFMRMFSKIIGNGSAALLAALGLMAAVPAAAQGQVFSSVTVDTSPLAEAGRPIHAQIVRAAVSPEVSKAFADRINPGDPRAPRLVIRITSVTLPLVTGSSHFTDNDFMQSEALVVDGRGRIISATPLLSPVQAWTASPNLPIDAAEFQRMRALGQHAAYWLKRKV